MALRGYFNRSNTLMMMDRGELKRRIQGLSVRPGFSEDYLETASVEKLKKILMAAAVNARSR